MQKPNGIKRIVSYLTILFLMVNLMVLIYIAQPALQKNIGGYLKPWLSSGQTPQPLSIPLSAIPSVSPTLMPTPTYSTAWQDGLGKQGTVVLSMRDGIHFHLFAYHPLYLPLTRLTQGDWDDISPSISPDGKKIAYASHQNGYWDIYILNFETNQTSRLTDTPEYDSSPSWSPDGQWITYESYLDSNLEILIRSVNNSSQPPIRLTNSSGLDCSPNWSPQGRDITFVSDRSGEPEIWLARLDQSDNRFVQVSNNPNGSDYHPHWSPDGNRLAWVMENEEQDEIVVKDFQDPGRPLKHLGAGDSFAWSPSGDMLLTLIPAPNQTRLGSYLVNTGEIFYPPIKIPGSLKGMDWKLGEFPLWIEKLVKQDHAVQTPAAPLWAPANSLNPPPPGGRSGVVSISNLSAPYPYLHDSVDEAYNALRTETHKEINWNFLDTLASAFQPLTEPPPPNMDINWLLTGRAFAVNPTPLLR